MITFVKTFAQELKKDHSLVDLLHKELTSYRTPRPLKVLRASQLTGSPEFCPREVALLDLTKKKQKGILIRTSEQVTYDQGLSLQMFVVHKWLKKYCFGNWRCQACGKVKNLTLYPSTSCFSCGNNLWEYREVEHHSLEDGFAGSFDAFIRVQDKSKMYLTEVKTIVKDQFKLLQAPLGEHKARTSLYLHLIRQSPLKEFVHDDVAKVLYISKAYGAKDEVSGLYSPFKEYNVSYDPQIIKPYLDKALQVKKFRESGEIPPRICPTSMVNRVKSCSCVAECFSGKYPSGVTS